MQVVVFGKQYKDKDLPHIQALFDTLYANGITTYVYTPYLRDLEDKVRFDGPYAPFDGYRDFRVHRIDFVIVLGGDGTMLNAVTLIRDAGVPMRRTRIRARFPRPVPKAPAPARAHAPLADADYMAEDRPPIRPDNLCARFL